MDDFPHTLFVIGTDTDVGKTFVSAVLTLGLNATYWKPLQCGVSPCTDTEWVHDATRLPSTNFLRESYRFGEPISPHAQSIEVNINSLKPDKFPSQENYLIIEGSGGIMLPLNEDEFFIDFMKEFGAPALLVVKNTKGAINQAILTMDKLKQQNIPLFGMLLNGAIDPINRSAIEKYCDPPRLFEIDFIPQITKTALKEVFEKTFRYSQLTSK